MGNPKDLIMAKWGENPNSLVQTQFLVMPVRVQTQFDMSWPTLTVGLMYLPIIESLDYIRFLCGGCAASEPRRCSFIRGRKTPPFCITVQGLASTR